MDLLSQHESGEQPEADIPPADVRDHPTDFGRIRRTVYEVQQHFRYCYAAPISDLRQRLVVVPRLVHRKRAPRLRIIRNRAPLPYGYDGHSRVARDRRDRLRSVRID